MLTRVEGSHVLEDEDLVWRPWDGQRVVYKTRRVRRVRTERRSMLSSFCRGTTVTSCISQRKAISEGTSPAGRGNAISNEWF